MENLFESWQIINTKIFDYLCKKNIDYKRHILDKTKDVIKYNLVEKYVYEIVNLFLYT